MNSEEKQLIVQYNPAEHRDVIDYNPVCWDKCIHIRLTEFGNSFRDSTITGFVDKLTFLITMIAKKKLNELKKLNPFNQLLLGKTDSKTLSQFVYKEVEVKILLDSDFMALYSEVFKKFPIDNIKLFPCVNKSTTKYPEKIVGDFLFDSDDMLSLDAFLEKFKISSLEDFLFDDGYELKIVEVRGNKNTYKKFYNKVVKKRKKELEDHTKQVDLW